MELEKRKKSGSAEPIHLVSNPDQLTEEERKAEANKQAEVAHLEASIKRLKLGLRQVNESTWRACRRVLLTLFFRETEVPFLCFHVHSDLIHAERKC